MRSNCIRRSTACTDSVIARMTAKSRSLKLSTSCGHWHHTCPNKIKEWRAMSLRQGDAGGTKYKVKDRVRGLPFAHSSLFALASVSSRSLASFAAPFLAFARCTATSRSDLPAACLPSPILPSTPQSLAPPASASARDWIRTRCLLGQAHTQWGSFFLKVSQPPYVLALLLPCFQWMSVHLPSPFQVVLFRTLPWLRTSLFPEYCGKYAQLIAIFSDCAAGNADSVGGEELLESGITEGCGGILCIDQRTYTCLNARTGDRLLPIICR